MKGTLENTFLSRLYRKNTARRQSRTHCSRSASPYHSLPYDWQTSSSHDWQSADHKTLCKMLFSVCTDRQYYKI